MLHRFLSFLQIKKRPLDFSNGLWSLNYPELRLLNCQSLFYFTASCSFFLAPSRALRISINTSFPMLTMSLSSTPLLGKSRGFLSIIVFYLYAFLSSIAQPFFTKYIFPRKVGKMKLKGRLNILPHIFTTTRANICVSHFYRRDITVGAFNINLRVGCNLLV